MCVKSEREPVRQRERERKRERKREKLYKERDCRGGFKETRRDRE